MKDLDRDLLISITVSALFWGTIAFAIYNADPGKCIKSHEETRHRDAYTTTTTITGMPWVGKGVPITREHPARDYNVTVCDEYEKKRL